VQEQRGRRTWLSCSACRVSGVWKAQVRSRIGGGPPTEPASATRLPRSPSTYAASATRGIHAGTVGASRRGIRTDVYWGNVYVADTRRQIANQPSF
jgi:hypothetical protein